MVVGARHALERGRGPTSVPVGTALLGSVLAVAALCATAVFGASLSHLTATPALYGDRFQLVFFGAGPGGPGVPTAKMVKALERNPAVEAITIGFGRAVSIGGTSIQLLAGEPIRGPVLLSTVEGQFPDALGQIALGSTTLARRRGASRVGCPGHFPGARRRRTDGAAARGRRGCLPQRHWQ